MSLNRKKIIICSAIFVFIFLGTLIPSRLSFTTTPSLKHRLFWLNKVFAKTDIKRGDYIMFRFATKYINDGKPIKAIKEVVCTPGDELKVNGKDYYCRGAYIGTAKDTAMTGDKVDNFKFNGAVPEQSYFVVGHIKDSYDSKYYGFIKRDNIEKIALPIY